jgi:metal-responsive CopG/Arc/MetJ family transcriptional regulator
MEQETIMTKKGIMNITVELTKDLVDQIDRFIGTTNHRPDRNTVIEEALCKWVVEHKSEMKREEHPPE